jgi:hypothetical protein
MSGDILRQMIYRERYFEKVGRSDPLRSDSHTVRTTLDDFSNNQKRNDDS